jgi:hypothetical protein
MSDLFTNQEPRDEGDAKVENGDEANSSVSGLVSLE